MASFRSSPFRRPASPGSPTAVRDRPATPPSRNAASPMTSPSKLKQSYTASEHEHEDDSAMNTPTKSSSNNSKMQSMRAQTEPPPTMSTRSLPQTPQQDFPFTSRTSTRPSSNLLSQSDNLSQLPPQLLHNLRESFSVLDSSSTGSITASSVAETLQSLGLQESNLTQFFPAGQSSHLTLPQYLNQLANLLVSLSPQQELLNAFSAFDDDDSGQIDIAELKTALLNTVPDPGERPLTDRDIDQATSGFTGRRILPRNNAAMTGVRGLNTPASKRNGGDVFRYQEFVANLTGGPATSVEASGAQQTQAIGTSLRRQLSSGAPMFL